MGKKVSFSSAQIMFFLKIQVSFSDATQIIFFQKISDVNLQ